MREAHGAKTPRWHADTVERKDIDWLNHGGIRDASLAGDFGTVIRQARRLAGVTQIFLAEQTGLSQSAISRLESAGGGDYSMKTLASLAECLGVPLGLVGLADRTKGIPVQRRELLAAGLAAALTPALADPPGPTRPEPGQAGALRLVTASYRRLDATTPSSELAETVQGHLRLVQTLARSADTGIRPELASVGSEAASFTAWLAWDMADHGSARRWYGSAVKAARSSGDTLLTAYQIGSLASFEAEAGTPSEALRLVTSARHQAGDAPPAVAVAWLSSIEAVAHAAQGDTKAYERALRATERTTTRCGAGPAPWPWIFAFDERKVAACRVACAGKLGPGRRPQLTETDITTALSSAHDKQRALLHLDVAGRQLSARNVEEAFTIASHALTEGLRLRSGRIVEKARHLRRRLTQPITATSVAEFDHLLHSAYL